jgi:hypothetical protein
LAEITSLLDARGVPVVLVSATLASAAAAGLELRIDPEPGVARAHSSSRLPA